MKSKALAQYLRKLKQALTCSRPDRARLLSRGRALLENFWEENPDADYEAFVTAFGPPELFAGEMLDTLDQENLKRARSRRKWVMGSVTASAAVVMLALLVAFVSAQQNKPKDDDIPPFLYGTEYPHFHVEDNDPAHLVWQGNMPGYVVYSLLQLESVRAVGDPYFCVVDDPDDPTRRVIQTNLPPEAVHFLLHPESLPQLGSSGEP